MEILELFEKWSINRPAVAAKMKMHIATFNNKLNPNNPSRFTIGEKDKIVNVLRLIEMDINKTVKSNWIPDQEKEKICPECGHENTIFLGKEYTCPICKNSWLPIQAKAQLF